MEMHLNDFSPIENRANRIIYKDKCYNISNFKISTHAMAQYTTKCKPGISLLEAVNVMKQKMESVKRVEINKKHRKGTIYYIDEDDIIYVTQNNTVITVYPNERIFVAKTLYRNKKVGYKYL